MMLLGALVAAYLLGSIPFSFVIARRVKGIDLRRHGSGNLGATNIFRTLGPGWGVLVLLLDMAKAAGGVLLMSLVTSQWPEGRPTPLHLPPDVWRIAAGFFAVTGHTFSPFVGFQGGKGVAATTGAFFILAPYAILTALAVFGMVFAMSRIVSLASLCGASVLPVAVAFFEWQSEQFSKTIFVFTLLICLWVIHRHQANIRRLQDGTEKPLIATEQDREAPERESNAGPKS